MLDFGCVHVLFDGHLGDDGSQVAACAFADDGQPPARTDFVGVVGGPLRREIGVLDGTRERVFRAAPIVHGDDDAVTLVGERPCDAVVCVEVADDPATAVEVDGRGKRFAGGRVVDSNADVPRVRRNFSLLDRSDRFGFHVGGEKPAQQRPGLFRREMRKIGCTLLD